MLTSPSLHSGRCILVLPPWNTLYNGKDYSWYCNDNANDADNFFCSNSHLFVECWVRRVWICNGLCVI